MYTGLVNKNDLSFTAILVVGKLDRSPSSSVASSFIPWHNPDTRPDSSASIRTSSKAQTAATAEPALAALVLSTTSGYAMQSSSACNILSV